SRRVPETRLSPCDIMPGIHSRMRRRAKMLWAEAASPALLGRMEGPTKSSWKILTCTAKEPSSACPITGSRQSGRHKNLRFRTNRVAPVTRFENPGWHPEVSRRATVQSELHRAIAEESSARSDGVLSRRRNFWCGRASRSRFSTLNLRFGSRTGHRSRHCHFQDARALGRGSKIQFHRLPLSRAGLPNPARAGHELFQYLFQSARRTYASKVFAPCESGSIRSPALDDHRKTDLVHR